ASAQRRSSSSLGPLRNHDNACARSRTVAPLLRRPHDSPEPPSHRGPETTRSAGDSTRNNRAPKQQCTIARRPPTLSTNTPPSLANQAAQTKPAELSRYTPDSASGTRRTIRQRETVPRHRRPAQPESGGGDSPQRRCSELLLSAATTTASTQAASPNANKERRDSGTNRKRRGASGTNTIGGARDPPLRRRGRPRAAAPPVRTNS